ncbi:Chloroplast protein FOR GROWTH AND FERTILITY 2 [Asimina triloba]
MISMHRILALAAGTIVLLSPLLWIIIWPILGDPAYADIQTTATIEGRLIGSELLTSAWTGFFAGWLHTLSAPDHLAALAPLSIGRTWMKSAAVGALWGCGHNTGQLIFGLFFLLLKDHLHIEVIHTWGTGVVGLTLLVIGGIGIRETLEVAPSYVASDNEKCGEGNFSSPETASGVKVKTGFVTFATGIVHGLQPDALMVVLSTIALPSRLSAASFLGMFLLGTILAMASYTVFVVNMSSILDRYSYSFPLYWLAAPNFLNDLMFDVYQ